MTTWQNNAVQFPRLLCEIMATNNVDLQSLAESMDLSVEDVKSLFDRAHSAWEAAKNQVSSFTGLMVSLDDGETWESSSGVRVMFHDANEGDEGMQDLLLNVTTEGLILDLTDQATGDCIATANFMTDALVELTGERHE